MNLPASSARASDAAIGDEVIDASLVPLGFAAVGVMGADTLGARRIRINEHRVVARCAEIGVAALVARRSDVPDTRGGPRASVRAAGMVVVTADGAHATGW